MINSLCPTLSRPLLDEEDQAREGIHFFDGGLDTAEKARGRIGYIYELARMQSGEYRRVHHCVNALSSV